MKILMLTSRFGSGYGMGYSSFKEATAFADLGHLVTVVHGNKNIEPYRDSRIVFHHIPISRIPFIGFVFLFFRLQWLFRSRLNPNDFDVVYIQSLEFGIVDFRHFDIPIFYFARSTMLGMRSVLQTEGVVFFFVDRIVHRLLVLLEKRCFASSEIVFVKSFLMFEEVFTLYDVSQEKIKVISGGIDGKDFSRENKKEIDWRKKLGIDPETYVVLYAGRLVPQKGLIYLVEASIYLLKHSKFIVLIAGVSKDISYLTSVKEVIERGCREESFYFLGHVDQMAMSSLYQSIDCLVTPSLYEPFGMVNLQGAFLNKTIITTTATGSADTLINYVNKIIVVPRSAVALKKALNQVIHQKRHDNLPGMDFSAFSWSTVAELLEESFLKSVG